MDTLVQNFPAIYNYFKELRRPELVSKCNRLRCILQQVVGREEDMIKQVNTEEGNDPCRKRKQKVEYFFELVRIFKDNVIGTLTKCEGPLPKWDRIWILRDLNSNLKEGWSLLRMTDQLVQEGLTLNKLFTRGLKFYVESLIGNTFHEHHRNVLSSIIGRAPIVGIHGLPGAGKTSLMKLLYNDVYSDDQQFQAVFWAGAPDDTTDYVRGIQDSLAKAMRFKFEDRDLVRRASILAKRLKDMGPGHVVIFLDNLKEPFINFDVGIPTGPNEADDYCCTLVFTTSSEDVCNRMRCPAKFKMDLLPVDEARGLFLHEVGWTNNCSESCSLRVKDAAEDVIRQCALMPLVIILIARSMTGKEDLCEWRNRLNELMGAVATIHGEEAKILEQLKFGFLRLKDPTVRRCFLASAEILLEGQELSRSELIQEWVNKGIVNFKRARGGNPVYHQGHTIINELNRVYLLEVVTIDGTETVRMNKWIRKMAEKMKSEAIRSVGF